MKQTMKPTVVILLSDKRSGSTMLQTELCKHPTINHVAYSPHTYFETHHWLKAACVLRKPKQLFSGNRVYGGYGSRANARTYLIDCIKENVPDFEIPNSDWELVFKGWDAICKQFAKPVFFEKSPQYLAHWASLSLLLEWIESTEYEVRVIGLVRNPLSTQYSAQKLFFTDPHKRQFGWAEMCRNLLSFRALLKDKQFLMVRYEELVTEPRESFESICQFIGVESDDNVGKGVHIQSINKWKDDLSYSMRLHPSVKQVARYFGYSDDDLDNPLKPVSSRYQKFRNWTEGKHTLMRARLQSRLISPIILRIKGKRKV